MYTFRETVDLGVTGKSMTDIRSIIQELKQEWPGGALCPCSLVPTHHHVCAAGAAVCSSCQMQFEQLD
jgi:hypothetical protein